MDYLYFDTHCIGVRDHFRGGGGGGGGDNIFGGTTFLPEFRIFARKSNMFGQCIFVLTWGGGRGLFVGGEYYFDVIV